MKDYWITSTTCGDIGINYTIKQKINKRAK